jgi:polyisoprenoid-binding protein YceI
MTKPPSTQSTAMHRRAGVLFLLPFLALSACDNPADHVPEAKVAEAHAAPAAERAASAPLPAGAKTYAMSADSKIGFVGSKVTGSHDGGFTKFAGQFVVVDGKLADDQQRIVIDMNSTWSDNERLTGHLKNADFFDVPTYPTSEFVSTKIEKGASGYTVAGNLTLHGVTKNISFPADIQISNDALTVKSEFHINRSDFDIKYEGRADDLIRKEVVLKLDVKATPGTADFAALTEAAKSASTSAAAGGGSGGRRPGGGSGGFDREAMMKRFDKNGDGQLDDTERAAMREQFGGKGRPQGQ